MCMYIYIYVHMCVCVCARARACVGILALAVHKLFKNNEVAGLVFFFALLV